jgi:hypothetical protein
MFLSQLESRELLEPWQRVLIVDKNPVINALTIRSCNSDRETESASAEASATPTASAKASRGVTAVCDAEVATGSTAGSGINEDGQDESGSSAAGDSSD